MTDHVFGGASRARRDVMQSMRRGLLGRCPHCGQGRLFRSYLKTVGACESCGEDMSHHRADDLPAYLVVMIVGHVVVGAFLGAELMFRLNTWQHLAIWAPLTLILSLGLLQPVKGAVVGLQWALYMHGFGGNDDFIETHPEL